MTFFTLLFLLSTCRSFTPTITKTLGNLHHLQIQENRIVSPLKNSKKSDIWKAGDWDTDLRALESGVALSNAPTDLAQKERLELLDEFARQRHDLIPDLMKYILKPVVVSVGFIVALKSHLLRKNIQVLISLMNASFWSISILVPLLLHCFVKKRHPKKRRKSEWEAKHIEPSQDTSDYPRCLLENWAISAFPMSILGCANVALKRLDILPTSNLLTLGIATCFAQLITRLGTVAAIHQFPKYNYDLIKCQDKGPLPLLQSVLLTLTNLSLKTLPLGFSSDVCQLYMFQVQAFRYDMMSLLDIYRGGRMLNFFIHTIIFSTISMAICQLVALKKIVRVGQFVNVSLATSKSKAQKLMQDPDAFQTKLRYRLQWREPRRLLSSFRLLARKFTLFIFTGWGEDASIVKDLKATPHLLRLIAKEMDEDKHYQKENREDWIPKATLKVSAIHQENYDSNTFEDPLGIAFHRTFGIGLSFDFDHDTKLEDGEMPSVHRLRARAAKSAIKRYHQLPDIVKIELKGLKLYDESVFEMELEKERQCLKSSVLQLLSLIPSNSPSPEGKDLDVLSMRQSEFNSLSGKADMPFLQSDYLENDDDNVIVIDPYLDDDSLSSEKKVFA